MRGGAFWYKAGGDVILVMGGTDATAKDGIGRDIVVLAWGGRE